MNLKGNIAPKVKERVEGKENRSGFYRLVLYL